MRRIGVRGARLTAAVAAAAVATFVVAGAAVAHSVSVGDRAGESQALEPLVAAPAVSEERVESARDGSVPATEQPPAALPADPVHPAAPADPGTPADPVPPSPTPSAPGSTPSTAPAPPAPSAQPTAPAPSPAGKQAQAVPDVVPPAPALPIDGSIAHLRDEVKDKHGRVKSNGDREKHDKEHPHGGDD